MAELSTLADRRSDGVNLACSAVADRRSGGNLTSARRRGGKGRGRRITATDCATK